MYSSKPGMVLGALYYNLLETVHYMTFSFVENEPFLHTLVVKVHKFLVNITKNLCRSDTILQKKIMCMCLRRNCMVQLQSHNHDVPLPSKLDLRLWDPCFIWGVLQGWSNSCTLEDPRRKKFCANYPDGQEQDDLCHLCWSVPWYKILVRCRLGYHRYQVTSAREIVAFIKLGVSHVQLSRCYTTLYGLLCPCQFENLKIPKKCDK